MVRERIGMSSLPVELLLWQLVRSIVAQRCTIFVSLLSLVRRSHHDVRGYKGCDIAVQNGCGRESLVCKHCANMMGIWHVGDAQSK